jgi:hypothetical protein
MRSRIVALLIPSCLAAQTLRLRYGGPSSLYHVRNVSGDTPAVVTVWRHTTGQQEHDLPGGDVVYLQFVPGCREANGYRKVVNSNQTAGTFAITDLNGNPITCSAPFDPAYESGLTGKVEAFTLRSGRPRIFPPGSGDLLTRSRDPDGSWPQVAPVVTENDISGTSKTAAASSTVSNVDKTSLSFGASGSVPPPAYCVGGVQGSPKG